MIRRRLSQHVREQNWLAIGLDLLIVVVGVYLGIGLGNWNDERSLDRDYAEVRTLLGGETRANLARVATLREETNRALRVVRGGFDALRACEDTPEAHAAVEAALDEAGFGYGMTIRTSALDRLLGTPALLARAAPDERVRLSAYENLLEELGDDIVLSEAKATEAGPVESPAVKFGPVEPFPGASYRGEPITFDSRRAYLNAPVTEVCTDPTLRGYLRRWEFWQEITPLFADRLEAAMTENLDALEN